jgi:hypothetical protein
MNSFARAIVIAATSLVAVTAAGAARSRIRAQPAAVGQSASGDSAQAGKAITRFRSRRWPMRSPSPALWQDCGAKDYGVAPK